MDNLRKNMAPISGEAWELINEQAQRVFRSRLSARRFVDVDGPHGWDFAAVPIGRLDTPKEQDKKGVRYGIHQVQPLVEGRISFKLNIWELDNSVRGAGDVDLSPLEEAAKEMSAFEDKAIYYGFDEGCIKGLKKASEYKPVAWPKEPEAVVGAIIDGLEALQSSAVEGPYNLVLSSERWKVILGQTQGYPLRRRVENAIGGRVIVSPHVKEAFLVSGRGGDFDLTLGADLSIGYEGHDTREVQLFFTESFTFRVLDPSAVVVIS
ncbi:MAG: bacteriocin family protein [Verrucomicrobia bacterium]|nr:bacteriocin family protein [Verrucomicrobiota bacterium]MCF7709244.1 bacteriocin family protein [Verrucomicrobiota bacterium]